MDEIKNLPKIEEIQRVQISQGAEKKVEAFIREFIISFKKNKKRFLKEVQSIKESFPLNAERARDINEIKSDMIRWLKYEITLAFYSYLKEKRGTEGAKFFKRLFGVSKDYAVKFVDKIALLLYQDTPDRKMVSEFCRYVLEEANKEISLKLKTPARGALEKFREAVMGKLRRAKESVQTPKYEEFEDYVRKNITEILKDMEEYGFTTCKDNRKCNQVIERVLLREFKKDNKNAKFLRYILKNRNTRKMFFAAVINNMGVVSENWIPGLTKRMLNDIPEFKSGIVKASLLKSHIRLTDFHKKLEQSMREKGKIPDYPPLVNGGKIKKTKLPKRFKLP